MWVQWGRPEGLRVKVLAMPGPGLCKGLAKVPRVRNREKLTGEAAFTKPKSIMCHALSVPHQAVHICIRHPVLQLKASCTLRTGAASYEALKPVKFVSVDSTRYSQSTEGNGFFHCKNSPSRIMT